MRARYPSDVLLAGVYMTNITNEEIGTHAGASTGWRLEIRGAHGGDRADADDRPA